MHSGQLFRLNLRTAYHSLQFYPPAEIGIEIGRLFIETIGYAEWPITGRIASTGMPGRGVASAGPVRCEIFPGIGPAKSADFPEEETSLPDGLKAIDRSPSRVAVHCNIVSGTEMAVLQSSPGFGAAEESQSGHE
jgi:hypothetical protein